MYRFRKNGNELIELEDPASRGYQMETMYVNCECSSADHTFRFAYLLRDDKEFIDDDLYMESVLCHGGFWYRLKTAFLYVINYNNIQRWNEVLITHNDARKIRDLCDLYLRSNEEILKVIKTTDVE